MLLRERTSSAHIATDLTIPLLAASGVIYETENNNDKYNLNNKTPNNKTQHK